MAKLTITERDILSVLDERGGALTGTVACRCGRTGRQAGASIRQWLLRLQRDGLVSTLDDQKPVCWIRTVAGTEALNAK